MSDSTEDVSHSDDNATTSGISGSDHEYSQGWNDSINCVK